LLALKTQCHREIPSCFV